MVEKPPPDKHAQGQANPPPADPTQIAPRPGSADDDRTQIAPGPAADRTEIAPAPQETEDLPALPLPEVGASDRTEIADANAPSVAKSAKIAIGTLINNNYVVREELKAGGMGEVYRGENQFTGDPVAIKVVLHSYADDQAIAALFKREARILGQLSDEAIVRYHNFVHDPDIERYCLIMEFVSGVTLSDLVADQGPLKLSDARNLLKRLAQALDRAHDSGVIHRDLSPDNVILRNGDVAQPVLIDFGIAKAAELSEGSLEGRFAGKFKFVSPEQLGHYGGEIGPRSDVYGLALLIAAALKGRPIEMGRSVTEAVEMRQTIPDLSDLPPPMVPLLSHMLEPDPANRPSSMAALVRMIDRPAAVPTRYTFGVAGMGIGANDAVLRTPGLSLPNPAGLNVAAAEPRKDATDTPEPKRKLGWIASMAALSLVLGGLAFEANRRGLFAPVDPIPPVPEPVPTAAEGPGIAPEVRFVAEFDTGTCAFAAWSGGRIVALSESGSTFAPLAAAYTAEFGSRPAIDGRAITAEQCVALNFAKQLARADASVGLSLLTPAVRSGSNVSGTLTDAEQRSVWLALVTPEGGVHNVTERLTKAGDSHRFSFGLQFGNTAGAVPQLVLAVASEAPILATVAAPDGMAAAELLPLVAAEIEGRDGNASATVAHFELLPPPGR